MKYLYLILLLSITILNGCGSGVEKGCTEDGDCNPQRTRICVKSICQDDPCQKVDCGEGICKPDETGEALCDCNPLYEQSKTELKCILQNNRCITDGDCSIDEICNTTTKECITNPCKDEYCGGKGTCKATVNSDFKAYCECNDSWYERDSIELKCKLKSNRCDIRSDCPEECNTTTHYCVENPCEGELCSNRGICELQSDFTAKCNCDEGYTNTSSLLVCINKCELYDECKSFETCELNGSSPVCIVIDGRCAIDSDCKSFEICNDDNYCDINTADNRCETNNNCEIWENCNIDNRCVLNNNMCASSNDCDAWETCNLTNHICEPNQNMCNVNSDCSVSWKECNLETNTCKLKANMCDVTQDCLDVSTACDSNHYCSNVCNGVTCSNLGTCFGVNHNAVCSCNEGYEAEGLNCVQCINGNTRPVSCGFVGYSNGTKSQICVNNHWEDSTSCDIWIQREGTNQTESIHDMKIDAQENVYIVGITYNGELFGQEAGVGTGFIAKYNKYGQLQWANRKAYSLEEVDFDNNGNIYVTGYTTANVDGELLKGTNDIVLIKYNSNGTRIWTKLFGGNDTDYNSHLVIANNHIYIAATTRAFPNLATNGTIDIGLLKIDFNGNIVTQKMLGTGVGDSPTGIIATNSYIYVIGGTEGTLGASHIGGYDCIVAKYDFDLNLQTPVYQWGTAGTDYPEEIKIDVYGNVYVSGHVGGQIISDKCIDGCSYSGDIDADLLKFDSNLNLKWIKQIGSNSYDNFYTIDIDTEGNLYVGGMTSGTIVNSFGNTDYILYKFDTNGNILSNYPKQFGGAGNDDHLMLKFFGNYMYFTGDTTSSNFYGTDVVGGPDIFIMKTKKE